VKNVELLEVTLAQLGGEEPATGFEETIRGIRYRVVQVPPPKKDEVIEVATPGAETGREAVAAAGSGGSGRRLMCRAYAVTAATAC
jgi:hypothetical protein